MLRIRDEGEQTVFQRKERDSWEGTSWPRGSDGTAAHRQADTAAENERSCRRGKRAGGCATRVSASRSNGGNLRNRPPPPVGGKRSTRTSWCASGEGDSPLAQRIESPPHPNPLPASGERESGRDALQRCASISP